MIDFKKVRTLGHVRGVYQPMNEEKYKGVKPVKFLSSWELYFCKYCDLNTQILEWGKESLEVKYADHTRLDKNDRPTTHRYIIDFWVKVKEANGTIVKKLVEIKPFKETQQPKKTGSKRLEVFLRENDTYIRNRCKWAAAEIAAKKRGMKFIVITEKQLFKM